MAKDVLNEENRKYLENVFESLDPIRLLQQIKNIQDSLWKHIVPAFSNSLEIEDPLKFDSVKRRGDPLGYVNDRGLLMSLHFFMEGDCHTPPLRVRGVAMAISIISLRVHSSTND